MNLKTFTNFLLSAAFFFFFISAGWSQTPFWSEDFADSTATVTNWVNGGTNGGTEVWEWTTTDITYGSQPLFGSTTASNGFVIFNSDFNGNFNHDVTFSSPAIDCSGQDTVFVKFQNQYAYYSNVGVSIAEFGVSTNGTDYTYTEILTDVPQNALEDSVQIVILEVPEAVNQPTVYLQVRWRGAYEYTWKIDDFGLYNTDPTAPIPDFDMRVTDFFAIPPNAATPASQVESFGFEADVENIGLMTQYNSKLYVGIVNSESEIVHLDSLIFDELAADSLAENIVFENEFTPPAEIDQYAGLYTVVTENEDAIMGNNSQTFDFVVTDTTFSKELGGTITGWAANADNTWAIGNHYYMPNGDGYYARYAEFWVSNYEQLAGNAVTLYFYKWDGDTNGDDFADPSEYELIDFNVYTFTGEETSGYVSLPISGSGDAIPLEDNAHYIISVGYVSSGAEDIMYFGFSEDLEYFATSLVADSLGRERYTSIFDAGSTQDLSYDLEGFGIAAFLRMSIGLNPPNAIKQPILPDAAVRIFPNPVNEVLKVGLQLDNVSEDLQIRIVDNNGKILIQEAYQKVFREQLEFNTVNLPNGAYFLRLDTDEGTKTLRFVVHH